MTELIRSVLIAALTLAPAAGLAQQAMPEEPPEAQQSEVRALLDRYQQKVLEAQEIEQQLEPIRSLAVEDTPALRDAQAELDAEIEAAFEAVNRDHTDQMARAQELHAEAVAAQEAEDHGRLQALEREAEEIHQRMLAAQDAVFARPEVAARVEHYQAQLRDRMTAIEPEAGRMLAELERVNVELDDIRSRIDHALERDVDTPVP